MSITATKLAASANPDRPYQLTKERSSSLLKPDVKTVTKLVKKQTKWETKLQDRLSISAEDAAVLLQITQHERGSEEFPLASKDKQQMMKLARQLSVETFGVASKKKGGKSAAPTKKVVLRETSDHTSVTEPETERSEDEVVKAVAAVKKSGKKKKTKKTKKVKKSVSQDTSVELDAIDSVEDKVVEMEKTMEAMKKDIASLVEINQRMASDLTEVLKRV